MPDVEQAILEEALDNLSKPDPNAHLMIIAGKEELKKLEEDAAAANVSPKLYKALELANRNPGEAAAILKQARNSGRRQ